MWVCCMSTKENPLGILVLVHPNSLVWVQTELAALDLFAIHDGRNE